MTANGFSQIFLYLAVLLLCVKPFGWYIAKVYQGSFSLEQGIYRLCGIQADEEMDWTQYLMAMLRCMV